MNLIEKIKYSPFYEIVTPIFNLYQYFLWYADKNKKFTPRIIKQKMIRNYAKKYSIDVFIETGTYFGETVNAVKNNFARIYTIELDKKLYLRAKNKFRKNSKVKIYLGDSAKLLPKILEDIKRPCIFWLDAHYSAGLTSKADKDTPIMEELKVILKHPIKRHLILIDDADAFTGKNDYPSLKELKKFLKEKGSKYNMKIIYNSIVIAPVSS